MTMFQRGPCCQSTFRNPPQKPEVQLQAMALPRRVPWTSQEEYEEVFSLLFNSNGDLNAQRRAVDRVRDLEKPETWRAGSRER